MKTIISDFEDVCRSCVQRTAELIKNKKNAVLALSADADLKTVYDGLGELCAKGELDFSEVRVFGMTEFVSSELCADFLRKSLLDKLNVRNRNVTLLSDDTYENYDERIALSGGIDLALLSVGTDLSLAFNEAGTPYFSKTHICRLNAKLKSNYSHLSDAELPDRGMTMGIKSITDAKNIFVTVFGQEKAEAVHKMLYARTDPATPAAFLQVPLNVTVFADEASSAGL